MLKKRRFWMTLITFLFTAAFLVACSGGGGSETGGDEDQSSEGQKPSEPVSGGTLIGAMDTAPDGQFNPIFYETSYDNNIITFIYDGLLDQNMNLEWIPNLATEWEFSEDNSSVTFKLRDDVKWHDGEQFTADDVVFTYKALADPDYTEAGGVRTSYVTKLVGYEEYNAGETDEFPGVVAEDDFTVTFNFKEPNVIALFDASFPIIPEHVFKDVPMLDMPSAPQSQRAGEVVGLGPYKLTEMIEGQEYVLTKNEDYYDGTPYIDEIVWRVVNQDVILSLLQTGEIDFVADPNGFQAADYDTVAAMDHVEIIEQQDFGYQIMGFKHNFLTPENAKSKNFNPDEYVVNEDIADPKVRQAIAFAVDRQGLIDGLLHGRGQVMNAPIAPQFWAYDGDRPEQYEHDLNKANQLLDEAGYVDTNDDGFRENPDGEEWVLQLAYPLGNKIRENSAPLLVEHLAKAGIKVELQQPMDMTAYQVALDETQEWDLYLLGWSLGTGDPDPSGLWTATDAFNFGRWNNPEADELVKKAITPPDAFDQDFRTQVYSDWQVIFQDDLPALILYAQNKLYAYNSKLQDVNPSVSSFLNDMHKWWIWEE